MRGELRSGQVDEKRYRFLPISASGAGREQTPRCSLQATSYTNRAVDLDFFVAASVSERMYFHSLTLAATTALAGAKKLLTGGDDHMPNDEQAIRDLVDRWMIASKARDLATVLRLMADDVIFMVPGQEPFGKETFASNSGKMKNVRIEGTSEIQEIKVLGEWAWMRNRLKVTMTPPDGKPATHAGYTLTVLRKQADGAWVIARDANLLMPQKPD